MVASSDCYQIALANRARGARRKSVNGYCAGLAKLLRDTTTQNESAPSQE